MKQRTLAIFVLTLSLTLLSCGMCNSPQRICKAGELFPPHQTQPITDVIVSGTKPTYQWEYASQECIPEGYHLVVSEKENLSTPDINLRESNLLMTWTPDVELKDCREYYWKVAAIAGDQDGPFSNVSSFRTDSLGTCFLPECAQTESSGPILIAPELGSITSTTPVLSWQYPLDCQPDSYVIQLSTFFDFKDTSLIHESSAIDNQWTPSNPLAHASTYYWRVAAKINNQVGLFSDVYWFYTGPECTNETNLLAPELIRPENGAAFSQSKVYLQWQPGQLGCIPDGYYRELQTAPDFSGFNLMLGITDEPVTTTLTSTLNDCTRYYWRIAAIQDGERSPKSPPRSFSIEISDTCMVHLPMGQVVQSVNCRKGPQIEFDVAHILMQGDLVELIGRNAAMTSLLVQLPGQSISCWAAMDFIEPSIDPHDLPVALEPSLPPPPEPQPAPCKDLSEPDCLAAGWSWDWDSDYCICPP